MAFGVTDQGFILKELSDIKAEIIAELRKPENFGVDVDLSSFSPIGIFVGLMSGILAEKWQALEGVYYSEQVDNSTGVSLDRVVQLRGVARLPSLPGVGFLEFTGAEGSIVPIGVICQNSQGIDFITTSTGTIAVSETTVDIQAKAIEPGASGNVPSGDITIISTPIPGITDVINNDDFEGGSAIETDAELRARYKNLVGTSGNSAPVIQQDFDNVTDVVASRVLENNLDITVGALTPHSINAIIEGGSNADIGEVFLKHKLTGIETIGDIVLNLVDENGIARDYKFERPTNIDIFIEYDITIDLSQISVGDFTTQFANTIKGNAIKYVGGTFETIVHRGLGIGEDLESYQLIGIQSEIPFIIGDMVTRVGKTIIPVLDRVDILPNERATVPIANIVLNIS